ncbi:MAG: hypothetical protein JXR44_09240 [Thiotrichales bacterium]|nr:hypothetical protein [Thiotrichales bacterium]
MKTWLSTLFITAVLFSNVAAADSWSFDGGLVAGTSTGGCTWSFDCDQAEQN